jgi:hypothetical protein
MPYLNNIMDVVKGTAWRSFSLDILYSVRVIEFFHSACYDDAHKSRKGHTISRHEQASTVAPGR